MGTSTFASRFLGFGKRGGTRRLKLATVSAGEWRLRVGCAVFFREEEIEKKSDELERACLMIGCGLTPGTRVGIIDGGVDVAQIDLAHETVDL